MIPFGTLHPNATPPDEANALDAKEATRVDGTRLARFVAEVQRMSRTLIVDDDSKYRKLPRELLERAGS